MSDYLTVEAYIARFGNQETTIVTAEDAGAIAPDQPKVESAIDDAEELANGYIAQRYAVPLASAPRTIVAMVADLARERLHKDRPTLEVTAAADRARSYLKDIAAGRLTLLLDAEEVATPTGDNMSASSNDAEPVTFDRSSLADFASLSRGAPVSCWKR